MSLNFISAYLTDAGSCRDGLKIINDHLEKFAKYNNAEETPYNKLGKAINKASTEKFDHMEKIETFQQAMKRMSQTMTKISLIEFETHGQIKNLVRDKIDPFVNDRIPNIQKQASKLSTYNADFEISQGKVAAAIQSGRLFFILSTYAFQQHCKMTPVGFSYK